MKIIIYDFTKETRMNGKLITPYKILKFTKRDNNLCHIPSQYGKYEYQNMHVISCTTLPNQCVCLVQDKCEHTNRYINKHDTEIQNTSVILYLADIEVSFVATLTRENIQLISDNLGTETSVSELSNFICNTIHKDKVELLYNLHKNSLKI